VADCDRAMENLDQAFEDFVRRVCKDTVHHLMTGRVTVGQLVHSEVVVQVSKLTEPSYQADIASAVAKEIAAQVSAAAREGG